MTAPTEAEIREAIGSPRGFVEADIPEALRNMIAPLIDSDQALVRAGWAENFYPPDDHPGTLWADLRPSEANELHEAVYAAIHEEQEAAAAQLVERLVAIGLAFAVAHPDIPRGHWPNGWTEPDEALDTPQLIPA